MRWAPAIAPLPEPNPRSTSALPLPMDGHGGHLLPTIYMLSTLPVAVVVPTHNGPKSLILAPQDIPDISGYQLGFGCQCVKAYNNENPVTNQKIL